MVLDFKNGKDVWKFLDWNCFDLNPSYNLHLLILQLFLVVVIVVGETGGGERWIFNSPFDLNKPLNLKCCLVMKKSFRA